MTESCFVSLEINKRMSVHSYSFLMITLFAFLLINQKIQHFLKKR